MKKFLLLSLLAIGGCNNDDAIQKVIDNCPAGNKVFVSTSEGFAYSRTTASCSFTKQPTN